MPKQRVQKEREPRLAEIMMPTTLQQAAAHEAAVLEAAFCGHQLKWAKEPGGAAMVFCRLCGAHSHSRVQKLGKECLGRPTAGGSAALLALQRGRHPAHSARPMEVRAGQVPLAVARAVAQAASRRRSRWLEAGGEEVQRREEMGRQAILEAHGLSEEALAALVRQLAESRRRRGPSPDSDDE